MRADHLKKALESDGGWPMHVDATGEHGQGTLLVVMAGWRKWVLGSWKIATERAELILPCLQDTVRRFGSPCAVMRDMGRAVSPAVNDLISELQLDIPVLACHQHFLSDIGTDLLKSDHSALRELFRQTKIRPKTNKLVRELGRKIGFEIDNARQAVLAWQAGSHTEHRLPSGQDGLAVVRALAQWVLDYKADLLGLDFPFDRPYLAFYNRCTIASRAADAFLRTPPDDPSVSNAIVRFSTIFSNVIFETQFHQIVTRLQRRSDLFDELRVNLRLAKTLPEKESEGDLQMMRNQFEAWVIDLEKRRPKRGPAQDIRDAIDIILKHIDKHGCNLWGHAIPLPEKVGGGIRLVARTNELLENFFGSMKHGERRRSGRKNLGHDLEHLPAEAVLACNLEHPDYVSILCGSIDQLPSAFAHLDEVEQSRRKKANVSKKTTNLKQVLQLSSSSLSTADRKVVRKEQMNNKIIKASESRAPRISWLTQISGIQP